MHLNNLFDDICACVWITFICFTPREFGGSPTSHGHFGILDLQEIEDALVKRDIKRQKLQSEQNDFAALAKIAEEGRSRHRGKMMLPTPQISESELEQIATMGTAAGLEAELADGAGGDATQQLLGQRTQTPSR